jgi:hypothetical protein
MSHRRTEHKVSILVCSSPAQFRSTTHLLINFKIHIAKTNNMSWVHLILCIPVILLCLCVCMVFCFVLFLNTVHFSCSNTHYSNEQILCTVAVTKVIWLCNVPYTSYLPHAGHYYANVTRFLVKSVKATSYITFSQHTLCSHIPLL